MMWYLDGSWYGGDWQCGRRHGIGVEVQPNGNRYEGGWKDGLRHGEGLLLFFDRGRSQEGCWTEGNLVSSTVEDIQFKQTAPYPAIPPIPTLSMKNSDPWFVLEDYKSETFSTSYK